MNKEAAALNALQKIDKVLSEVREQFPEETPKENRTEFERLLRRASGIIANYNSKNAERKLRSLIRFMDAVRIKLE